MSDQAFELLVDLHKRQKRQGPGGDRETRLALELAGLDRTRPLRVADIGCGTGASTILLAKELDAHVTAVDLLPAFLEELESRARDAGVTDAIRTLEASMDKLPFEASAFDVIWSEGAVYQMGFERGVRAWRRFLKPGGTLIVSEITWLGAKRPGEIEAHWEGEYPEIDLASAKMAILERNGYVPEGYFTLPKECWLDNYYRPLQTQFDAFLSRHPAEETARAIVDAERAEIDLYERYGEHYSYGVYVARKV